MQTCTDRLIGGPDLAIAGFDFVHRVIVCVVARYESNRTETSRAERVTIFLIRWKRGIVARNRVSIVPSTSRFS